jgi:hypothetical protein
MLRKHVILLFIFLCLRTSVSFASSDYGCGAPRGTIFFLRYESCTSGPFISPANDSRLNLELLGFDAGRLAGSLNTTQTRDYPIMEDYLFLRVPFDMDSWQLSEPGLRAANKDSTNSSSSANDYAQGEGSRCNSAAAGLKAFENAVNAAVGLAKEDAAVLIEVRSTLIVGCSASTPPGFKAPQGLRSALARDFATYIAGVNAFYAGDFASALENFNNIKNSTNPWLKETSHYMVGRTLLNSAQRSAFGEWGDLKLENVDKYSLKSAEDAFNSYLHDFPRGMYAASSQGLQRRVYWLGGNQTQLAEALDRALVNSEKDANNVTRLDLVQEADAKLLASVQIDQIKSPRFLAIVDLMRMRSNGPQAGVSNTNAPLKLMELEAQKNRFASNPALYNYLLAAFHLYVDDKPDKALEVLPSVSTVPLNYFAFSQQTLRMLALEAGKQSGMERKLVLEMLPLAKLPLELEQLQLALARVEVLSGHTDRIFASDSPIREKAIRTIVVEYIASAEMLRERIKDPKENTNVVNAALYSLLYKELTGAKYQAFQADLALMPPHPQDLLAPFVATGEGKGAGYQCPAMREVAATLQRDGNDARSLNCVGELVRLQGVHYGQGAAPPATDLGGVGSLFPVTNYSRLDGYMKVIANHQAERDPRAYALYRAVRCYAPSGNNDCGRQDIPQSTRKQWFDTLHKEYPDSVWAKSLKYYW